MYYSLALQLVEIKSSELIFWPAVPLPLGIYPDPTLNKTIDKESPYL